MFSQQILNRAVCMTVFYVSLVTLAFCTESSQEYKRCYKTNSDKRTFKHQGIECDLCRPGQFMVAPCTGTGVQSTRCAQCLDNTYMPYYNECDDCWQCTAICTGLNQITVQECNGTHERQCGCEEGTYPSAAYDRCVKYECPAGKRVRLKTGKFGIDVKCRPCRVYTYSPSTNAKTFCIPHTNCTALGREFDFHGNTTHDAICQQVEGDGIPTTVSMVTDKKEIYPTERSSEDKEENEEEESSDNKDTVSTPKGVPTTENQHNSKITNRIKPYPTNRNETAKDDKGSIDVAVGVSAAVILITVAIMVISYCYYKSRAKKSNSKRKYSIPLSKLKKIQIISNEQERPPKPSTNSMLTRCFVRQRSTSDDVFRESLLQGSITLKSVQGKGYDDICSDFLMEVASGVRQKYWRKLFRADPPPYLTEAQIDGVEYKHKNDQLDEVVYQCLLCLKKNIPCDDNPIKNILLKVATYDKKLAKTSFGKYCEIEYLSDRDPALMRESISDE